MKEILFYIIVPIYNVEKYLRDCLDSIANQTYSNFMAILIDDGSEDSSGEIAMDYRNMDSRFVLISQENRGLSGARNAGLDYIANRGGQHELAYIVFVDSDDYLEINALEILSTKLSNTAVDVLVARKHYVVKGGEKRIGGYSVIPDYIKDGIYDDVLGLLNGEIITTAWAFIIEAKFCQDMRFIPKILYEDVAFCARLMFCRPRLCIDSTPIYNYVYNPDSIMHSKQDIAKLCKSADSFFVTINDVYKLNDGSRYFNKLIARLMIRLFRVLIFIGYRDDLIFDKSDLRVFYPYLSPKYKFCYHFPRVYGIPKRIRLFATRLIKGLYEKQTLGLRSRFNRL